MMPQESHIPIRCEGQIADTPIAYCVHSATGRERQTAQMLKKLTRAEVLFPTRKVNERVDKQWLQRERPLLPGYLFIYAQQPLHLSPGMLRDLYRVLSYGDQCQQLRGSDYAFALWVYRNEGCIDISRSYLQGSAVRIVDGPLVDYQSHIIKVDRHKRRALISLPFAGRNLEIWLCFDWLEPLHTG